MAAAEVVSLAGASSLMRIAVIRSQLIADRRAGRPRVRRNGTTAVHGMRDCRHSHNAWEIRASSGVRSLEHGVGALLRLAMQDDPVATDRHVVPYLAQAVYLAQRTVDGGALLPHFRTQTTTLLSGMEYFDLNLVSVAAELAATVAGVTTVRLFGSRKYPGKVRSDLDLLVYGPSNLSLLLDFRSAYPHYRPLDLWLATAGTATSAVNGSVLPIDALHTLDLYPSPDEALAIELRVQRFRTDIDYALTIVTPESFVTVRGDQLGFAARNPKLLDGSLLLAADAITDLLRNSLESLRRMRYDGHALRGKGMVPTFFTEYDLQNLTELVLAPLMPIEREPFVIFCEGVKRTADFSLARGRLILELKLSKTTGAFASALKDVHGILNCYLDHPGVEVALAVLGVAPAVKVDRNAVESWTEERNGRRAIVRMAVLPGELLLPSVTPFKSVDE